MVLGPHSEGKLVLCLFEIIDCGYPLLSRCGAWKDGQYRQMLADIALSSHKGSKPFCVEYVAPASECMGRLYARQSCAQRLPRTLRTILYGASHWEVDISGATMSSFALALNHVLSLLSRNSEDSSMTCGTPIHSRKREKK